MSIDLSKMLLSRRSLLKKGAVLAASAAGGLLSCDSILKGKKKKFAGSIMGANRKAGHMLLDVNSPAPSITEKTGIVIAGGGIAGLSAARELMKNHFTDFLLLELEDNVGGNSISGANKVSAYPWGAHYVPIPGKEAVFVRDLFEELGIIEGYNSKGLPIYNEFYLCADPQERLFIHGLWQEGIIPHLGISEKDRLQYNEFFKAMEGFKKARGNDGKRAFSIPIDNSSRDARFLELDTISMAKYLSDNGWNSEYLRWYINYCCRDDYGCVMDDVSAWAGIHYFAARTGAAANADTHAVVTWPEGNGWIARKMAERFIPNIRCNACVLNIESSGNNVAVDYYDLKRKTTVRLLAESVIYAAPRFTAFRTIKDFRLKKPSYAKSFGYSPWMIANITVRAVPEGKGATLSWDNVSYNSKSLGYVLANHQDIKSHMNKSVLTYYMPLTFGDPDSERARSVKLSHEEWAEMIVNDLSQMHHGIGELVEELNVWLWGHAMIRPATGFIWSRERFEAMKPHGRIFFAHSDMSGISLFEEAQYWGILASKEALHRLNSRV